MINKIQDLIRCLFYKFIIYSLVTFPLTNLSCDKSNRMAIYLCVAMEFTLSREMRFKKIKVEGRLHHHSLYYPSSPIEV